MKITSYYVKASPGEHFTFWEDGIGVALPTRLSEKMGFDLRLNPVTEDYEVSGDSEIAFCQLFLKPKSRPAKFVYTVISDVVGHESQVKSWIASVKPNLLLCLQTVDPDIVRYGAERGCSVELFPWFVLGEFKDAPKTMTGLCTGCTDPGVYPNRARIASYLSSMNRSDVVVSCSHNFGKYKLSNSEYADCISRCKYYLSGAIYDKYIPPKYYEAAANGACLVTFHVPGMESVGFVHGETCIVIKRIEEIPGILASNLYDKIGKNAKKMALRMHTVENRAGQIQKAYDA